MQMIHFSFHAVRSTQTAASGLSPLTEPMPESTLKSLLELTTPCVLLFVFEVSCLAPAGPSFLPLIWLLFGLFSATAAAATSGMLAASASVGVTVMLGTGLWGSLALVGVVGGGESRTSTE